MNLLLACKCLIFQPIYLGLSKQAKQASKNITELDFQWPLSSRTLTNMVTWERMLVLVPIALLADFSPRYTLTVKQWLKQVDCCAQPNSFFFCCTGHILLLLSLHSRILQVSHCSVCQCLSFSLSRLTFEVPVFCWVFFLRKDGPSNLAAGPPRKKYYFCRHERKKKERKVNSVLSRSTIINNWSSSHQVLSLYSHCFTPEGRGAFQQQFSQPLYFLTFN